MINLKETKSMNDKFIQMLHDKFQIELDDLIRDLKCSKEYKQEILWKHLKKFKPKNK